MDFVLPSGPRGSGTTLFYDYVFRLGFLFFCDGRMEAFCRPYRLRACVQGYKAGKILTLAHFYSGCHFVVGFSDFSVFLSASTVMLVVDVSPSMTRFDGLARLYCEID